MDGVRQVTLKTGETKNIQDVYIRDISIPEDDTIKLGVWSPENAGVVLEVGGIYYLPGLSANDFRGEIALSTGKNTKIERKNSMNTGQPAPPAPTPAAPKPAATPVTPQSGGSSTTDTSNAIAVVSTIMALQGTLLTAIEGVKQRITEAQVTILDQLKIILDQVKPKP